MKCPHCGVAIPWTPAHNLIGQEGETQWLAETQICAGCNKLIVQLVQRGPAPVGPHGQLAPNAGPQLQRVQAVPRSSQRPPCPPEVPAAIRMDYVEACLVLEDSPKASAALSRRCLQHILRDKGNVKPGDLANEIDQVIDAGKLPSAITESLDAVRVIGNFAAHPMKSTNTGGVIDVEVGEAEWNLDVIETLMDVLYVRPALLEARKAALNAKLGEAGKPQLP